MTFFVFVIFRDSTALAPSLSTSVLEHASQVESGELTGFWIHSTAIGASTCVVGVRQLIVQQKESS